MTRNLKVAMFVAASFLAGSGAYASEAFTTGTSSLLQPARMECSSHGCRRVAPSDRFVGDAYNYYRDGRVCMDVNGYPCASPGSEMPLGDFDSGAYRYRYGY